jgi:hypothetical protein
MMLHCNKAGQLTTVHVPGVDNVMADVASRPEKSAEDVPGRNNPI